MEVRALENAYSDLVLDSGFIELELLYQKPNIFTALKLEHYEIRHSNFLGWLLDPNQTHGLGSKFLKLVMADILKDERIKETSVTSIGKLNLDNAIILREWNDIDILIKIDDLIITIENKVWSNESSHQLKKYKDIITARFGNSQKVFVFLTPNGHQSSMNDEYVNYSYERIIWILELITNSYSEGISGSVKVYLDDYIETLKAKFMKNGEVNILAREVYLNHKELFDFILNHRTNFIKEVQDYIFHKLKEFGYVKKTCDKQFVRFLPKALVDVIPNNGSAWKKEAFLFEFSVKLDEIAFLFTIAPGEKETRTILETALLDFKKLKNPYRQFIGYNWFSIELTEVENLSTENKELDKHFDAFWKEVNTQIESATKAILNKKDELLAIRNKTN
jgi:hypothetical protein